MRIHAAELLTRRSPDPAVNAITTAAFRADRIDTYKSAVRMDGFESMIRCRIGQAFLLRAQRAKALRPGNAAEAGSGTYRMRGPTT